jgi:hypothetical protein
MSRYSPRQLLNAGYAAGNRAHSHTLLRGGAKMSTSEKIQLGSLLIALLSFVAAQVWLILQQGRQDRRRNTKLDIFLLLGKESLTEEQIRQKYQKQRGTISESELRKAMYEMLVDETAYYEWNDTYRAHWRNPKKKDSLGE